ncbi:MAG: sigma-54 dependent transcriptional regulator [Proteobacteria bacterium]|nr:sigma-54 dependent transcriptional regulator [Pseudomonadota bacterium]
MKARLLLIDDEPRLVEVLRMVLAREGYTVEAYTDAEAALEAHAREPFDLIVTDLRMPKLDGLTVMERARHIEPELPVILITAHGSVSSAIAALRQGAFDYVQKPCDNDELKALVRRALELTRMTRENRYLRAELRSRYAVDQVVAESAAMREVLDLVRRAARSPATVLITGESGTGKELVARALHFESDRVGAPFVAVNCKAFAEGVLESELFGHERGAFTGADRARAGLFEQADGGTLFLDEIGEVSPDFQAKLLRVLQDKSLRRVGGDTPREVDVRVVAATNRDLPSEVEAGRFREDLYFRLAVIPVQLAPLRERPEDVLPLAHHFLAAWNHELGREIRGFGPDVDEYLRHHTWPGNVRELQNAIERGVVLARGSELTLDDLLVSPSGVEPASAADEPEGLHAYLERATVEKVRQALRDAGGRRMEAARQLGIDRTTLYRLIRKYKLDAS